MSITPQQFTTICDHILVLANRSIPAAYQAQLKHDQVATSDKGGRATLMFSIWGKVRQGFWHRGYCSYSIVYDPYKLLSQRVPFQVRFVYFHSRKETSLGRFDSSVRNTLAAFDGEHGFVFEASHKTYQLRRPYNNPTATPQWQQAAADD